MALCGMWHTRPRIRRLADLSSTHPIRRRPCADPVQKQVSGEWMTQKGIDLSRPVTEARMERSEIRGPPVAQIETVPCGTAVPDFASLHPGYACSMLPRSCKGLGVTLHHVGRRGG